MVWEKSLNGFEVGLALKLLRLQCPWHPPQYSSTSPVNPRVARSVDHHPARVGVHAMRCQSAPGLGPTATPVCKVAPSISHTAAWPPSCCQRMSALPSPLKSTRALDVPVGARIGADHGAADQGRAVHQPDRGLAVVVLPEDVGLAVAVEVAGIDHVPVGARVGTDGRAGDTLVPFISQIAAWPLSFCQRMSSLPSPLKSPAPSTCQLGPGIGARPTGAGHRSVPFISQIAAWPCCPATGCRPCRRR